MSSRQNPLHLSSCYLWLSLFWGSRSLTVGFCGSRFEIQHEAKIHSETGSEMDRAVVLLVSGAEGQHFMFLLCCIYLDASSFMFLSFACIFLSMCIHFLSLSFHVSFIGIHFHSCSFHIPFMFIPMCIHVLSCSFHFALMSFHFLSKVMEMAP